MANTWFANYAGPLTLALVVLVLALAGIVTWLALRMVRLERHYQLLTAGTDGGNLAAVLEGHVTRVREASDRMQTLDAAMRQLERDSCRHIQHLGFLRYNPFRETGGDQSFVLALADSYGNGAVMSSMHSRDVTRIYAKPLAAWRSSYPLTEEEEQAIQKAKA